MVLYGKVVGGYLEGTVEAYKIQATKKIIVTSLLRHQKVVVDLSRASDIPQHLMKRGTRHNEVLRKGREVFCFIDSFVFSGFPVFAAPVFEAVFLCPIGSVGAVGAPCPAVF